MNDQKNNGLNAFVTGAVLGALATFLFATKSGRKIKDELIEEGIRIFEAITEEIEEAPEQIKEGEKEIKKELTQKAQEIAEVKEQIIFPEINYDKIDKVRGLDVVIVTSARSIEEAKELLKAFHMPFIN